jgi:type VI secretion system protein ImpH
MASTQRRTALTIADELFAYPQKYDFFQAIRLLEALNHEKATTHPEWAQKSVGYDYSPQTELIHFSIDPTLKEPDGTIAQLSPASFNAEKNRFKPANMQVSFMGLTGPSGVLPLHYSEMILQQNRSKNFAMRDFFDIFNHRAIAFHYRAFTKYRIEYHFEYERRHGKKNDALTKILKQLVGLSTTYSQTTHAITDDNLLYYVGLFAQNHKSAIGLKSLLSNYFQTSVNIKQFIGSWNKLQDTECTRMPSQAQPQGQFNTLGKNTMLGKRVWYSQGKFRIELGPLSPEKFKEFLPRTTSLQKLKTLVQTYVGPEFNFDVQLISEAHKVPPCQLSAQNPPQLGYFTWLPTQNGTLQHDQLILT